MLVLALVLALSPSPPAVLPASALPVGEEESRRDPIDIIALANEGFLVRCGDAAVLIDAFVERPYGPYAALPEGVHDQLASAEPPFDDVDLALVSHVHADHFQAASARAFLRSSPDTVLATSPQVIASLREGLQEDLGDERIQAHLPGPGESETVAVAGVEVEFLRLSHGSGRFATIENLGHVITIGGWKLLHVGDAAMESANFEPYRLSERELDFAFVPDWYFRYPGGRTVLRDHLKADTLLACHIELFEMAESIELLAQSDPEVLALRGPLETRTFRDGEEPGARRGSTSSNESPDRQEDSEKEES